MRLIDAHQHYWQLARGDYGWLTPELRVLYRDFLPETLAAPLAECGIGATVLVQAAATEAETRYLIELALAAPSVAGIVGWVDFEAADVRQRVRALAQDGQGRLKGLRPMIQDIPDPRWLERTSIDAAFAALIDADLCFDALVKPQHLPALARRLQRHPGLRAVLDHAGKPDIAGGGFDAWAGPLADLAQGSSVHCKISGLLTEAAPGADLAALEPFVAHLFECFGAQRILWGSDWPVVTLRASYQQWWKMARELVRRHAPGQEAAVFGGNAARFYRLD
jgi:L-fuconolactonase